MLQYSKQSQYCKNASNVSKEERIVKDDSQSVLRSLSTLMFSSIMNLTRWMLLVTNHILDLWGLSNYPSNSFVDFYSCEAVSSSDMRKSET